MSWTDVIVLSWTVLQSTFSGFAFRGLMLAREDRILAERDRDDDAAEIVTTREKRSAVRVVGFVVLTGIGLWFLLDLGQNGGSSVVMIVGLFVASAALGSEDVIDQIDRAKFRIRRRAE